MMHHSNSVKASLAGRHTGATEESNMHNQNKTVTKQPTLLHAHAALVPGAHTSKHICQKAFQHMFELPDLSHLPITG
jgi:hypothetical protein